MALHARARRAAFTVGARQDCWRGSTHTAAEELQSITVPPQASGRQRAAAAARLVCKSMLQARRVPQSARPERGPGGGSGAARTHCMPSGPLPGCAATAANWSRRRWRTCAARPSVRSVVGCGRSALRRRRFPACGRQRPTATGSPGCRRATSRPRPAACEFRARDAARTRCTAARRSEFS